FWSRFFLSDDFRIYMYSEKGSFCYYRGYIDGIPSSSVTLSTCSGLRGLLQFENITYGIEPLGYSPAFEHFVYRVRDVKAAGSLLTSSRPEAGPGELMVTEQPLLSFNFQVFRSLNLTVMLSSVEVWMDNSMVRAAGNAENVLLQLLKWKKTSRVLQPPEVPYLLLYGNPATFVGTTVPGKLCQRDAAGIVALQKGVSLESFSALLAQLLGRSLGIGYDKSPQCHCPRHICIMSPEAKFNGAKAFSSCSIRDFQTFLKQNKECPVMRQAKPQPSHHETSCGNGVVEAGEQCDCGSVEVGAESGCKLDKCCTPQCLFKPGVQCSSGLCCQNCQFKRKHSQCRPAADEQCDLAEFCTGASASCPPDLYVQDGHGCEHGTGYCYKGRCQSPDLQCQQLYGKGNGCAEVNSQQDRFGHCGKHPMDGYKPCSWNLGCGKLVCVYPNRLPFTKMKGAIIYAHVQEHLCVSFDFMNGPTKFDPLMVKEGTKCGPGKVCLNGTCHPHSVLNYDCDVQEKCHGHGVCNNKKNCHCDLGWSPPNCETTGPFVGGSIDSPWEAGGCRRQALGALWFYWVQQQLLWPHKLIIAAVRWRRQKGFFARRWVANPWVSWCTSYLMQIFHSGCWEMDQEHGVTGKAWAEQGKWHLVTVCW
uniref:ADAM metallopeptidase domain 32 n=1 Tax=Strigops habroptila TaxID=2489341 RepID=A0A672U8A5_STRHB